MILLLKRLSNRLRVFRLRLRGAEVGEGCRVGNRVRCRRGWRDGHAGHISIGALTQLEDGVVIDGWGGRVEVGSNVFLGPYVVVYGHGGVTIGDNSLVAAHCRIMSANHAVPPFDTDIRSQADILLPVRIGRDVWLGAGVTILGGVTVGDGCVVGAGAVLTKDLPAGAIAYGVPATVKGFREGAPRPNLSRRAQTLKN